MLRQQGLEFVRRVHLHRQRVRLRRAQRDKQRQGFEKASRQGKSGARSRQPILGGCAGMGQKQGFPGRTPNLQARTKLHWSRAEPEKWAGLRRRVSMSKKNTDKVGSES